ncbi:MAG: hypothetical protein SV375_22070, partial [Thermodesulfobacteriota bacterium]|nr:hypothetical protein [Thermodesulfobacteriota bacterium]
MKRFIGRGKRTGSPKYSLWAVIFFISMFTAPATAGDFYLGAENLKTDMSSPIMLAKKTGDGTPKPMTAFEGKALILLNGTQLFKDQIHGLYLPSLECG